MKHFGRILLGLLVAARRAGRRGVASVELAMVVPIVVIIVTATYDLAGVSLQKSKLVAAARAGGYYALSFPTDTDGIARAITNALPTDWTSDGGNTTVYVCGIDGSLAYGALPPDGACPASGPGNRLVLTGAFRTFGVITPFLPTSLGDTDGHFVSRIQ